MDTLNTEGILSASEATPADEQAVVSQLPGKIEEIERRKPNHNVKVLIRSVRLLFSMLRDPDFRVSLKAKAIALAALLYFIVPIDAIPDYIPLFGYVDDSTVIAAVLKILVNEIDAYRLFSASRAR